MLGVYSVCAFSLGIVLWTIDSTIEYGFFYSAFSRIWLELSIFPIFIQLYLGQSTQEWTK